MTLGAKQRKFTKMIALLILFAYEIGYELSFGEAWRTPEQAAWNAKKGIGIENSLHIDRLAVDFNLFKDGKYITKNEEYTALGLFWESIGGTWGGRFRRPDSGHFSLTHGGRS